MTDVLFARAQLAIEESRTLQDQSHALRKSGELEREGIRRAVFDSASVRSEIKAYRDDRSPPPLGQSGHTDEK